MIEGYVAAPRSRSTHAAPALSNMIWIPGGTFRMGSDKHYPEEAPAHRVTVDAFWIDRTPMTNREFRKFVNATGYVTLAEIKPDAEDLRDWSQWWNFKFGANWRRPYGPRSSISRMDDHPVVHIAYRDAKAYAKWAG